MTLAKQETMQKAQDLYATLVALTSGPAEAVCILEIILMLLWLNHKNGEISAETMLDEFKANCIKNLRLNEPKADLQQ